MRRPKNRDRSRLFICTGENFRDKAPIGDCGDVKTLMGWLIHLSNQDEEYLDRFFDDSYKNADIVDYIYRSWGKRLEEVGK
jgi:hypothetical protein